jgi:hypothetical protein
MEQNLLSPKQFAFLNFYPKDKSEMSKEVILKKGEPFGFDNDSVNHFLTTLDPKYLQLVKRAPQPNTFNLTDYAITAIHDYLDKTRVIGLCRREIYKEGHIAFPRFLRQNLGIIGDEDYELDVKIELLSTGEFIDRPTKGFGNSSLITKNDAYLPPTKTENYNFGNVKNFAKDVSGNVNQESLDFRPDIKPQTQPKTVAQKITILTIISSLLKWVYNHPIPTGIIVMVIGTIILKMFKII